MTDDNRPSEMSFKTALDILTHFHIVLKLIKVYEANNLGFMERLRDFWAALNEGFKTEDKIQIQLRQDSFFVNKIRLKFNIANYIVYKSVIEEFLARQIGTLTLFPDMTEDELVRFIVFLSRRDLAKGFSFERTDEELHAGSFPDVQLKKLPKEEHIDISEKSAIPIYILGVHHLKDLFESQQKSMNIHLTRRWIQSLINHLMSHEAFLIGLTNIKNFQEYTLNHSVNVCILSLALGRRLGLTRPELIQLGISACLHDVGKFDIPNEILDKPGKLEPEERAVMEKHSHIGAGKLARRKATEEIPDAAVQVAMEHHIKPGMSGYPKYARRKKMSLFSQIVKVIDYYDAITTKRVYRPKTFTPEEALKLMQKNCAEEFEPLLFKAFVQMMGVYPVGTLAAMNSGEVGIVVENNPLAAFAYRPMVKLITDQMGRKIDGPVIDMAEQDPQTKKFKRTIVKALDPEKYNIQVTDYLMATVQ
ncbi:MAG: HD domain-containing protein [Candidatus Aminicenantes bacterium]|nr:HD domain-containing protein [Candidatus Aminicenantes bacterium]